MEVKMVESIKDLDKTHADLIERYIWAVVRHLGNQSKSDIYKELECLIIDMLNDKSKDGGVGKSDVYVVLKQLGSPEQLALRYCNSNEKAFINGINFLKYKQILKVLLPFVASMYFIATLVSSIAKMYSLVSAFEQVLNAFATAFLAVTTTFSIVTVVFYALSRFKAVENQRFDEKAIDMLPVNANKDKSIPIWEPILAIALHLFFVSVLFLPFSRAVYYEKWIAVYNSQFLFMLLPLTILVVIINTAREIFALIESGYTKKLFVITLAVNVITVLFFAVVLLNNNILSLEFVDFVDGLGQSGTNGLFVQVLQVNNILLFLAIVLVCFYETISTWIKSRSLYLTHGL